MNKLRELTCNLKILIPLNLALIAAQASYILPASEFIRVGSTSAVKNFYVIGGFMLLTVVTCLVELALVRLVIWGAAETDTEHRGDKNDVLAVRAMGATGTKLGFVFAALAAVNIFVFDFVGAGVLVTKTREHYTVTMLRSPNRADRTTGAQQSITLTGNKAVQKALEEVISNPGEGREWAAWALGTRNDKDSSSALRSLLESGTPIEMATSAMALARLKDTQMIPLVINGFERAEGYHKNLVTSLGLLSRGIAPKADLSSQASKMLAANLSKPGHDEETKQLIVWALGELRSVEGVAPAESLLSDATPLPILCSALSALGKIGAADSSPRILEFLYKVDGNLYCKEIVYRDFTGYEVLTGDGMNLHARILYEIANIGDRRARQTLDRITVDEQFSTRVRTLARDIAHKMRITPLPGSS